MDDDSLNMQNWGYYDPSPNFKGHHLSLQLMSTVAERDAKPFIQGRDPNSVMISNNTGFHPRDCLIPSDSNLAITYPRQSWGNARDSDTTNKQFTMIPPSSNYPLFLENPAPLQAIPSQNEDEPSSKKRESASQKNPKAKKARKRVDNTAASVQRVKQPKRTVEVVINGIDMDISGIPIPVCSCTGAAQQCYRWGCGGWQSACCTTNVSMYPLPMSTKRRGARIAGRKMSQGAFKKVLEKLASEGYIFSNPIDLRTHWAKHGTNKFVTIR